MKKRVKKVFSRVDQVAEIFAKQSQSEGRSMYSPRGGGDRDISSYFENNRMYSYGSHYLLAIILEFNGRSIAAVNFKKYSMSTSRHSRETRQALEKAGHIVIVLDGNYRSSTEDGEITRDILIELEKVHFDLTEKFFVATFQPSHRYILASLLENIQDHNKLCEYLGLLDFKVETKREMLDDAMSLSELNHKAATNHKAREQISFFNDRIYKRFSKTA